MDAAQESATQQGCTLPPESLRQDSSPSGAPCVDCFTHYHFASVVLMCYPYSASRTRKEEQREEAEEERACCVESIPVNALCSLIAVNKGRNYYPMEIYALPMHTYTFTCLSLCCHAENMMFNFMISMFPYFHPSSWRKSEQNTVRINSFRTWLWRH